MCLMKWFVQCDISEKQIVLSWKEYKKTTMISRVIYVNINSEMLVNTTVENAFNICTQFSSEICINNLLHFEHNYTYSRLPAVFLTRQPISTA